MGVMKFALLTAGIIVLAGVLSVRAETGLASWYGYGHTACGDRSVPPMSAAHKTLPCGTRVRVTIPLGPRRGPWGGSSSVIVTIRDRGPYVRGRIIDVSPDAARKLGLIGPGVLPATLEVQ
jgi:rare lipoprotein A